MDRSNLLNIDKYFDNMSFLFAHKKGTKYETIKEHMDNSIEVFISISQQKKIENIIDKALLNLKVGRNKQLSNNSKEIIKKLFINAIYLHDIGKINPKMQIEKFQNKNIEKLTNENLNIGSLETDHSLISAILYIETMLKENEKQILKINEIQEKNLINLTVFTFAYIISSHHSNLVGIEDLIRKIMSKNIKSQYFTFYKEELIFIKKIKESGDAFIELLLKNTVFSEHPFFVIVKLLESSLIASDFISTHNFFLETNSNNYELELIKNHKLKMMNERFKSTEIVKGIERYKKSKENNEKINISEMNKLRSEMFLESLENYKKAKNKRIFFLESPTGSGKTNTSLNVALNILEDSSLEKIIYTFPFNTLAEQTVSVINNIFETKTNDNKVSIEIINSITPISMSKKNGLSKEDIYKTSLLDRQLWNYDIVCTSHVNLFNSMFGTSREANMSFFQLINSVIILDEIQSYKNTIWKEMIDFLNVYAEILNIKVIIMSATLPNLSSLISKNIPEDLTQPLITNRKFYFENPVFKNRVTFEFLFDNSKNKNARKNNTLSRKNKADSFKILVNKILEKLEIRNSLLMKDNIKNSIDSECVSKILLEFISKGDAQEFEKYLKNTEILKDIDPKFLNLFKSLKIYELDGDTCVYDRLETLNEVKENNFENLILITTQIIEAGVDIDMDLGFKDSSLLDSEEQMAGRINRNNSKKYCKVFLFNFFDESILYGKSDKNSKSKRKDFRSEHTIWDDNNFETLKNKNFPSYYEKILKSIEEYKKEMNINNINLFYKKLKHLQFKEIEKHMKLIDQNTIQIFIPCKRIINGKEIDGEEVWREYKELLGNNTIGYAEKRIRISNINQNLSIFTFQIYGTSLEQKDNRVSFEQVGGFYYVKNEENGKSKYLDYDNSMKFKRDSFKEDFKTPNEPGED